MAKVKTVEEIMGFVKELTPLKLHEFKCEFDRYISEIRVLFSDSEAQATKIAITKETEAEKIVTKENEPVKTIQAKSEVIKKEVISKEETSEKEISRKEYKKPRNASSKAEWQEYFKRVKRVGYQHGSQLPENAPLVLTASAKDTDECILAALVNVNGVATNAVWSGAYPLPLVFNKISLKSLEQIKKAILHKWPENAQRIEACKGPNGQAENFYYDELENGNFCHRITQKDGSIVYFGYMIDQNICFYKNPDNSISMIDVKYFFMPRWGTQDCRNDQDVKIKEINSLIERAFGNDGNNDTDKNVEDIKEEVNDEANRQLEMDRRAQMRENQKSKKRDLSQDRIAKRHKRRAYEED